jgi:choline dehydrogenase-like flavoprotein
MGGTRMGTDPAVSVVDADCKVHGTENLFVGGSSVFATSGQCTPTTTLTALAVRLGDHLGRVISA